MRTPWSLTALAAVTLIGCGGGAKSQITQVAQMRDAFDAESDRDLAAHAMWTNLNLIEALTRAQPKNEALRAQAADAYSSAAIAFVLPELWAQDDPNGAEAGRIKKRMNDFQARAFEHATARLAKSDARLLPFLEGDIEELKAQLAVRRKARTIDAMFWYAHTSAMTAHADPQDRGNAKKIRIADTIMEHVRTQDETIDGGLPILYFAIKHAHAPEGHGRDLEKARKEFDAVIAQTGGKALIHKFWKGYYYCGAKKDRACFDQAMDEILAADVNVLPEQRFWNGLAQDWAASWKANAHKLFGGGMPTSAPVVDPLPPIE